MLLLLLMDSELVENIEEYYKISHKIAGEYSDDLLHQTLITFTNPRKLSGSDLKYYFVRVLTNEYRNKHSAFNKLHKCTRGATLPDSAPSRYDGEQLNEILNDLSKTHPAAVKVFKKCYFESNVKQVAKELGVHRMQLYRNYLNFVRNEIKKRYVHT